MYITQSDYPYDTTTRREIFFFKLKGVLKKLLVVALITIGIFFYATQLEASRPNISPEARAVDRRAAAKEAIELYSANHPEFTKEEIEEIFRGVLY